MQPDRRAGRLTEDGSARSGPRTPRGLSMPVLRPRFGALAVLTLVLVAACGSTTPSVAPSAPPSDQPSEPPAAETGSATWWVGSDLLPLAPETTEIKGILMETACASGQSPEGRVNEPVIQYTAESVTVTFTVTPRPGAQDCPGNPEFPVTFTLSEPLGERALLDGGSTPPRDATTTP